LSSSPRPRPPPPPLFPYTTLFRSSGVPAAAAASRLAHAGASVSPRQRSTPLHPRDERELRRRRPGLHRARRHLHGRLGSSRHGRSEEHTSELQSLRHLVCRLLLEK